jgi:hypothetical protein
MFTEEEKQIIELGKQNGKSPIEVKRALAKYRSETGYVPTQAQTAPQASTIGSRVSGVIQNAGSNVADAIAGDGKYAGESSIRRGVEATAEAFKAVPGVAIAAAPDPVREGLGWVGKKVGGAFGWLTDKISDIPALQKWTVEHPEAAKALEEVAGTAKAGGEIAGTILLADQTAKLAQAGVDKTGQVISAGATKLKNATQPLVDNATELVKSGKIQELIKPTKDVKGAVGEVLQGKPKDIQKGMDALKAIDTDGVKTYADLKGRIDTSIGNLSRQVDDVLSKDQTKTVLDDLATQVPTKAGGVVSTNYVDTSLRHLKELYSKTGDVANEANIDDLINSAKTGGLTKLDVNNISRVYNAEFGNKAFSKATGEPLTSVNAQLYETVRSGLKDKAREGLGGTEAAEIDHTISSLYNTRDLVAKNVDAVARLQQKIAGMGILEKVGHSVTKYADIISGGSIRGLIGGMLPRGAGYKVMNALDLEERLRKNLDIINGALNSTTETGVITAVKSLDSAADTSVVSSAVNNHLATAQQIIENTPADKLAGMGGMPKVLSRTQTNIVDGLKGEGAVQAAEAVAKLSPSSFSTLSEFKDAVLKALSIK